MEGIWRHRTETALHDGAGEGTAGSTLRGAVTWAPALHPASPPVSSAEPQIPPRQPWTRGHQALWPASASVLSHPSPPRPLAPLVLAPSLTLWSPRPCVEPLTVSSAPPGPSGRCASAAADAAGSRCSCVERGWESQGPRPALESPHSPASLPPNHRHPQASSHTETCLHV